MIGNIPTLTHLLLILGVALLVLGPERLPEAGRGLGSALRGFKDALSLTEDRDARRMMGSAAEREHQPQGSTSENSAPSERQETDAA